MRTPKATVVALGLLALAGWSSAALAGEAATVNDSSSASDFAGYISGWRFSVSKEFTITHLGLLDVDEPGLTSTHTLTLWKLPRTGGFQKICTVEIGDLQGELIGSHRYVPITPIKLVPDANTPNQVGSYLYRDRFLLGVYSPAGSPDKTRIWNRAAVTISDIIRLGEAAAPEPGFAENYTAYLWRPQEAPYGPYTSPYDASGNPLPPWGAMSSSEHYAVNFKYTVPGPQAEAGPDVTIYTSEQALTVIAGAATHTNPGTTMTYQWFEGETLLQAGTEVTVLGTANLSLGDPVPALSIGSHTLTLEVTDGAYTATDTMTLTLTNTPPEAQVAPAHQVLEINMDAIVLTAEVADFDGDTVQYRWLKGSVVLGSGAIAAPSDGSAIAIDDLVLPAGDPQFPLGTHEVQFEWSDGVNPVETIAATIEIKDTAAPTLTPTASTTLLWPPNWRLVPVTIWANAFDNGGGPVVLSVEVTSDEPPCFWCGFRCGGHCGWRDPDWFIDSIDNVTGEIHLRLRAERYGWGDGRVYTITITATDQSLNQSTAKVEVRVPHDRRRR